MNNTDDNDLGRRLRAIDQSLPFDADAFAERVIAERSRRRRRRVAASCTVTLTMAAIGLVWHWSRAVEPQPVISDHYVSDDVKPDATVASSQQRIDELDALLRQIEEQRIAWERLDRLAERLAHVETALAEARKQRNDRQLAFARAELSAHVKVPDLTRFYVDATDEASL